MRIKRGKTTRKKHKKLLKQTRGMKGLRKASVKKAREALMKAWSYSYRDRRAKKRDFRRDWITIINAACRENDVSYSQFTKKIKEEKITLDRKVLADIAKNYPDIFIKIVKS